MNRARANKTINLDAIFLPKRKRVLNAPLSVLNARPKKKKVEPKKKKVESPELDIEIPSMTKLQEAEEKGQIRVFACHTDTGKARVAVSWGEAIDGVKNPTVQAINSKSTLLGNLAEAEVRLRKDKTHVRKSLSDRLAEARARAGSKSATPKEKGTHHPSECTLACYMFTMHACLSLLFMHASHMHIHDCHLSHSAMAEIVKNLQEVIGIMCPSCKTNKNLMDALSRAIENAEKHVK